MTQDRLVGEKPKETSDSLTRKANDLQVRLDRRLELVDQQAQMSTKPPLVVAAALVLPIGMLEGDLPPDAPIRAKETKGVERRGIALSRPTLSRSRALCRFFPQLLLWLASSRLSS